MKVFPNIRDFKNLKAYLKNLYNQNKTSINYFVLPRIFTAIIAIFFYEIIHLGGEKSFTFIPNSIFTIPDLDKYNSFLKYNPLFSLTYQIFFANQLGIILGVIFGQLISSYSCLSIYKSSKKIIQTDTMPRIILIFMAINPLLLIYSLKFCTENFAILGIALFLKSRTLDNAFYTNNRKVKIQRYLMVFQFLVTFFRSQFQPIFIIEFFIQLKMNIKKFRNKIKNKKILFTIYIIISIIVLFVISLIISSSSEYIYRISSMLWNNHFPIKAKDIYDSLSNNVIMQDNKFITLLTKSLSWIIYLIAALIFLTGSRGRFTDMPWILNIGNFEIINNKQYKTDIIPDNFHLSMDPTIISDNFFNNFNQTHFILVVIIPMLLLSSFHLLGIYGWIYFTRNNGMLVSIAPLTICLVPILFYPYMRYFIPLAPLSCVGIGLLLKSLSQSIKTKYDV